MKKQELCRDFLGMQGGRALDAIEAANAMNERWGIRVDWHEMAYALDELERRGEATRIPGGRELTRYYIG
jgi:hypothetical protein